MRVNCVFQRTHGGKYESNIQSMNVVVTGPPASDPLPAGAASKTSKQDCDHTFSTSLPLKHVRK